MKTLKNRVKNLLYVEKKQDFAFYAIVILLTIVTAYFAEELIFYKFDLTAAAYTMELQSSAEESNSEVPIQFVYQGEKIILKYEESIEPDDITLYASSRFGLAVLTEENMAGMSEYFLGSYVSALPTQVYDADEDGSDENVFLSAKTDIRTAVTNTSMTPFLKDKAVMFEAGVDEVRHLILYYNSARLTEREVLVTMSDGTQESYQTDEYGRIDEISIREIQKGITISYAPNGKNIYITRYIVEHPNMFSSALIPLLNLAVLSVAGIMSGIFLRKKIRGKHSVLSRKSTAGCRSRHMKGKASIFEIVRWCCMLLCFFAMVYGGALLGNWFENVTIPVFSCGKYNQEQLFGSSCYYMSHLNLLIQLPWQNIVMFLLSFFIPTILLGRALCGFACPMGLVQDTLDYARKGAGIEGISLTERLYLRLATMKWAFVLLFLCAGFAGLDFCNICPVITLSPAFSGFKTSIYAGGFVMLFVIVGSFFKRRFFCNICPLGVIMGLFHGASLFRLKKDCTACTECGACYEACPMGIKQIYTERVHVDVTSLNCIMCGECIRQCPENQALSMTFAGKSIYTSSRERFIKRYQKGKKENDETRTESGKISK